MIWVIWAVNQLKCDDRMNRLYLCELWMLRTDILYSELLLVQTVGGISSIIASHNKDIEMELIVSMTQLS